MRAYYKCNCKSLETAITDKFGLVMFVIVLVLSSFLNISPIFFVLGSGFLGFLFKTLGGKKVMLIVRLFYEFFKIGLFAIGGGMATLPFLYNLAGTHPDWFNTSQLMDMVAVSESTPGPMGVNMSTYVGFTTGGIFGGVCATLGLVIPSIIVILIVAKILNKVKDNPTVQKVIYGIRPASMGLIAGAAVLVMKEALINVDLFKQTGNITDLFEIKSIIFAVILYILMVKYKKHPIIYVAFSAVIGCIIKF